MQVTMVGFLVNARKKDLETAITKSGIVDDFDMEELDKKDGLKDVTVILKNPIDAKFVGQTLTGILGTVEQKLALDEE